MATTPAQLALLADHIKLSLLERQRALSLKLDTDSQNAEISRSLESFRQGLEALEAQESSEDVGPLRQQYTDLNKQFGGAAPGVLPSTINPNTEALLPDFEAATKTPAKSASKSVRFSDKDDTEADERSRANLFNRPYRDDPSQQDPSYSDDDPSQPPDHSNLDNQQIHAYHTQVLAEQDQQLDTLGSSVRRIGDLSISIGNELDEQNTMLGDLDGYVTTQQSSIDRARDRVGRIARKAKDNWSITTIGILILVLIFVIAVLK